MTLREVARIRLPPDETEGGFDHAAVDGATDRLFVAHPANDAVEVVDLASRTHLRSIRGLTGVAGVWVSPEHRLLFTSNRGEDTASVFRLDPRGEKETLRIRTGARPNGMAYDPARRLWMIAGVGNPREANAPPSLTFVGLDQGSVLGTIRAAGRTRWATYHPPTDAFYVNIADPASILRVSAADPTRIERAYRIPAKGPHGMEQDPGGRALFCACDEGVLVTVDVDSGEVRKVGDLAGPPDVLWLDASAERLYAATDEPGTVGVFSTDPPRAIEEFRTAPGAHTLTVDPKRHEIHVFLPGSHEDLVLRDAAGS